MLTIIELSTIPKTMITIPSLNSDTYLPSLDTSSLNQGDSEAFLERCLGGKLLSEDSRS